MASQQSRKAPFFFSWSRKDYEAFGLDALSPDLDWAVWELPYLFPPFPLIAACLEKIIVQKVPRVITILPYWPGKVWFSQLMEMAIEIKRLPPWKSLVIDKVTGCPPPNIRSCNLVVAILSGHTKEQNVPMGCRIRQETSLKRRGDTILNQHTHQGGDSGNVGPSCTEFQHLSLL